MNTYTSHSYEQFVDPLHGIKKSNLKSPVGFYFTPLKSYSVQKDIEGTEDIFFLGPEQDEFGQAVLSFDLSL